MLRRSNRIAQKTRFGDEAAPEPAPPGPAPKGEMSKAALPPSDPSTAPSPPPISSGLPPPSPIPASEGTSDPTERLTAVSSLHRTHHRRLRRRQSRTSELIRVGCEVLADVGMDLEYLADYDLGSYEVLLWLHEREGGTSQKRGKRRREPSPHLQPIPQKPHKTFNPLSPSPSALDDFAEILSRPMPPLRATWDGKNRHEDDVMMAGEPRMELDGVGDEDLSPTRLLLTYHPNGVVELHLTVPGRSERLLLRGGVAEIVVQDARTGELKNEMRWWWE